MMEMSPWLIYWLMQLDRICEFVDIVAFLGFILLSVLIVARIMCKNAPEHDDGVKMFYDATTKICRFGSIIIPVFILLNVFIPSTKTVAAMILVPPIVNNEQVQQIPEDILTFVRSVLKEHTLDSKEK